jgi:hypothetical protein
MDQIGYGILLTINALMIASLIYIGIWTPKERMKGHAGRGKCKCKACQKPN